MLDDEGAEGVAEPIPTNIVATEWMPQTYLEKVIAGLSMRVAYAPDEVEILKEQAERDLKNALNAIKLKPLGLFLFLSISLSLSLFLP